MNSLLLAEQSGFLLVVYIVIGALLTIALIWAFISKVAVASKYTRLNKVPTTNGVTGEGAAKLLLEALGMPEVQIEKMGGFKSNWFGNSYSSRKKTIRLRKNIADKDSVTSVALACQKVGLAYQHKTGDKKFKLRAKLEPFFYFAPFAFIPLLIVGLVVDALAQTGGIVTAIATSIGFLFYVGAVIVQLLVLPTETKASKEAIELIERAGFLTEKEVEQTKSIYKSYKIGYIAEFVTTILYIILQIIKILIKVTEKK